MELVLRVGLRKKLDATLKTSHGILFFDVNHILMVSRGSRFDILSPCWDLLTRVGLGTHVNQPLHNAMPFYLFVM